MITDVHTHIFPDFLAEKAMNALTEHSGPYKPYLDGTLSALLSSMDRAGIDRAFIASIATKPEQSEAILKWSLQIRSERIIPLGSVHPADPLLEKALEAVKQGGLPGIKLHPMYQNFSIDDKAVYPLYEKAAELNLFILMHAGFDIAFPGDKRAMPSCLAKICDLFPDLMLIAAHWGGWQAWDEVCETLAGRNIYFDTSFTEELSPDQIARILKHHPGERFLFASDSPWTDQAGSAETVERLPLSDRDKELFFSVNAEDLLRRSGCR